MSKTKKKFHLGSKVSSMFKDLIHKTSRLMPQWIPTGNVCIQNHTLYPICSKCHSGAIPLWNTQLISTKWNSLFFGKACGWCWCQCIDMWFSQWSSVACWIDATGRPEVTTETTRLSTSISAWKFDELICVSHIVHLISVTRIVPVWTSCSFCIYYDVSRCLSCSEVCVHLLSLSKYSTQSFIPC